MNKYNRDDCGPALVQAVLHNLQGTINAEKVAEAYNQLLDLAEKVAEIDGCSINECREPTVLRAFRVSMTEMLRQRDLDVHHLHAMVTYLVALKAILYSDVTEPENN